MDFGDLFSRAWRIVWHNKFMFVLGFMAALGSAGGSGGSSSFRSSGGGPGFGQELSRIWTQYSAIIIGMGCFLFILAVVFWLIRLAGQAGMISAASRIEAGEKLTFSDALGAGTAKLAPVMGLSAVMFGPLTLLGVVGGGFGVVTAVSTATANGGQSLDGMIDFFGVIMFVIVCLICLLAPLYFLITLIYPFAQRSIVLQGRGVFASIRHGWRILRANVADVLLLALFFLVLGVVFGMVGLVAILPVAALIFVPLVFSAVSAGTISVGFMIWGVVGVVCLGFVGAAINSVLISFRSATMTLAYEQFVGKLGQV